MQFIKKTIVKIVLGFLFFVVLTPVGISLRIMGIDFMHRKPNAKAKTYWKRYR
jgi:hypothetical protein